MKFKQLLAATLTMVMSMSGMSLPVFAESKLIAFPGAEGGGMYTLGARASSDMEVYHVTNLADSGSGSFRDAVSQGDRIIVFDVAGTIMLKSDVKITVSNLTVLGQTAPGEGICIGGESVRFVGADEVILRYLRFRMGDNSTSQEDGLGIRGGKNIIVDHCSVTWSIDECLSSYENMNTTVQNCIISESLRYSTHEKGAHGYGGIWGGINASFHHNLLSTHDSRNPRIGTSYTVHNYNDSADTDNLIDIRNNVIYNWETNAGYGGENGVRVNLVNNYYKPATATDEKHYRIYELYSGSDKTSTTLHVSGNVFEGRDDITEDNWNGVNTVKDKEMTWTKCESISDGITVDGVLKANDEFIYDYPVTTSSAEDAYSYVLDNVGASIYRDSIDTRIVNDVKNGTYPTGSNGSEHFIDSQEDVGGFIALHGEKRTDSDNDGMSDEWETANGLNPNSDDSLTIAENGYTNIENYANYLATTSYSGYTVDDTSLKEEINLAKKLSEADYTAEVWANLQNEITSAETVYYLSTPTQTQIDEAYNSLVKVVDSLEVNHARLLQASIEKAKAIDESLYSYDSISTLNEAVVEAEAILEAENVSEYDNAIDAIESAISKLKESNKPSLKKYIDFVSAMDLSHLTEDSVSVINTKLDEAKAVYDNPQAYYKEVKNAETMVKSLISQGNYTRINYGKIVDIQSFEDGNIYKDGYSFTSDTDGTSTPQFTAEVVNGYGDNSSNVMQAGTTSNDIGVYYNKASDLKSKHFMISYDMWSKDAAFNKSYITIYVDGQSASCMNNSGLSISSKHFSEDIPIGQITKADGWNNFAAEVDLNKGRVVYYINNMPVLRDWISGDELTGYSLEIGNGYSSTCFDNFMLTDLDDDYITGDSDNDGILTANDAAQLLQRVLRAEDLTTLEQLLGNSALVYLDMDCSGALTSNDCALILAKVLNSSFVTPADEKNSTTTSITTVSESTTESTTSTTESTTEETTESTTSSIIKYNNDDGTYSFNTVTGNISYFDTSADRASLDLTIPTEINGIAVSGIGNRAFRNCNALRTLTIPGSIKTIGGYAFEGCDYLESVVIEEGIEQAGNSCFANCSLYSAVIPSTLKKLPNGMFQSCPLTELEIPEGVEEIGSGVFPTVSQLKKVVIPKSVTTISSSSGLWAKYVTVYCYAGTYAETYAIENSIPYEIIQ